MNRIVPLAFLPSGTKAIVKSVMGGRGLINRLNELGFTPDSELTVIHSSVGPLLVSIRGSRVGLGRGVAMKIFVEVVN